MGRLFGTDGVRGVAGVDLTADLARALGRAAVGELLGAPAGSAAPRVVVGRDTRPSGPWLEAAVAEGCAEAGAVVASLGVIPTPGVAHAVVAGGFDLGVMISASHNPAPDNGIKFFTGDGFKLPDEAEDRIETRVRAAAGPADAPAAADVTAAGGAAFDSGALHAAYVEHLLDTTATPLAGVHVVVDCANGAASTVAPEVYRRAGADVTAINDALDGAHINDGCGATHLDAVRDAVLRNRADVGLAHDGDADRCIAVDAHGDVVDGDAILAVLALALHERGDLAEATVVTTVMTNLGFKRAMNERGIAVVETPVGDRYVLEAMRERGFVLGGEQSGHLIMRAHSTTGDGVLTGVQLLARMAETGRSLRALAGVLTRLPQVLLAVPVADREVATAPPVTAAVAAAEAALGEGGRVLVRPSGTEPVVRVMVEATEETTARVMAERVAAAVQAAGGR